MSKSNIVRAVVASSTKSTEAHFVTTKSFNDSSGGELGIGLPADKRIIYEIAAITMTVLTIYVIVALSKFNCKKSECYQSRTNSIKRNRNSAITSDSSTSNSTSSGKTRSTTEKNAHILRMMSLAAAVFTFVRIASEQLELAPPNGHRVDCRDYQIAMVVTYCIAVSMLYAILWYRVKVFLSHPAMKHLGSKILNALAYVVLFLIAIASIANATMFLVSTISKDDIGGCVVLSPGNIVSNNVRFAILTVSTVISQVSLLALFLYPLIRHRAAMQAGKIAGAKTRRRQSDSSVKGSIRNGAIKNRSSSRKEKERRKLRRQRGLVKIIKRVMVTAIACAISDVFCGLIVRVAVDEPRIVTNLIFDANLLINLGCVLASFKDWRLRLIPCYSKRRKHSRNDSELHTANSIKDKTVKSAREPLPSSSAAFALKESLKRIPVCYSSESGIHSISPPEGSVVDQVGELSFYDNFPSEAKM